MPNPSSAPVGPLPDKRWRTDSASSRAITSMDEAPRAARHPIVRYLGFRSTDRGREYSLQVADGTATRLFVLLITHQAFAAREARFQDAPDVCSGKLRRELEASPDLVPTDCLAVTAQDLLDYKDAREHRVVPGRRARTPVAP